MDDERRRWSVTEMRRQMVRDQVDTWTREMAQELERRYQASRQGSGHSQSLTIPDGETTVDATVNDSKATDDDDAPGHDRESGGM